MRSLTILLLALGGCFSTDPATDSTDDGGTDDTDTDTSPPDDADDPEHAIALALDEEASDTIHDTDVDWYQITGAAGQQFRVQVVNDDENASEESLDTVVEVFKSDLTRIAWEDDHPVGDVGTYDTVCFGFFPADGSYYVTVQDKSTFEIGHSNVESTGYTLTVLSPSQVPEEPDSVLSVGLSYGMETENSWYAIPVLAETVGDQDFVKLVLGHSDGALTFAAAEHIESSGYQPSIEVYNSDAEPVLRAATVAPSDGRQLISPPGTEYILGVEDSSLGSGPAQGMWVFVANAEAGYGNTREVEPNDLEGEGMALTLVDQEPDAGFWFADYAEGRIGEEGDVDGYEFTTTDEGYITISFGALSYGSLLVADVSIWQDGVIVASGAAEGGVDPKVQTSAKVPAGAYSVRVSGGGGSTSGEGAFYRLAVHSTSVAL
ncbi:hypothetical protein LBMAG42_22510 [Deltaproteobacteria bacterium]|nr:hypothetical protein LBMAG42_22510 [Deltaproteobacteria bacterium]